MDNTKNLEKMLTELASRVDGAIDFWTTLCFLPEDHGVDFDGFLNENSMILRTLVGQIEETISELKLRREDTSGLIPSLSAHLELLFNAFVTLGHHRKIAVKEIQLAVDQLAKSHDSLIQLIRNMSTLCDIELTYWRRRTPERELYYNRILTNLFALAQESCATGTIPQSLQMPYSEFQEVLDGLGTAGLDLRKKNT